MVYAFSNIIFVDYECLEDGDFKRIFSETMTQIINIWEPSEYNITENDNLVNKFLEKVCFFFFL
jgi:spore coat polysaccharide biosynthesis predicted glycosyltransferase SpsG